MRKSMSPAMEILGIMRMNQIVPSLVCYQDLWSQ